MLQGKAKVIAEIKAAMWENGNLEALIEKAIRSYVGKEINKDLNESSEFYIHDKKVKVINIPHVMMDNKLYENLLIMIAIEKALTELYTEETIPDKIDFDELLN